MAMGGSFPYWSLIVVSTVITLLAGVAGAFVIYYSYYRYPKRSSAESREAEQRGDQDSEDAEVRGCLLALCSQFSTRGVPAAPALCLDTLLLNNCLIALLSRQVPVQAMQRRSP